MPKGGGKGKPKEAGGEKPDKKAGKEKAASKRSLRKSQSSSVVANENKRRSAAQGQDGEGKGAGKQEPVVEPEWNSESVRAHKLLTDGFTYSMIMGMEDSSDLTSIGYYLYHAIKTGVRKRFIALSGEEIASVWNFLMFFMRTSTVTILLVL
ncbi:uncharacterized protein LOC118435420 [Folsomia candida]|uniref:uncharacterized protein LOC118435420 n=1 Tax=Folsomia candida TaxID=158441 RepID=UPI0016054E86|nr:uncharacterized protein LOC118435420 [Folsomia candida]